MRSCASPRLKGSQISILLVYNKETGSNGKMDGECDQNLVFAINPRSARIMVAQWMNEGGNVAALWNQYVGLWQGCWRQCETSMTTDCQYGASTEGMTESVIRNDANYNQAITQQFDTQNLCEQVNFMTMPFGAASGRGLPHQNLRAGHAGRQGACCLMDDSGTTSIRQGDW